MLCVCESASRPELRCVINDGERVTPVKPRRPPERAADSRQNKEESLATLSHRPPHAHRNSAVCALCVFAGTYCVSELPEHRAELEGTLHCCSHHQQADRLMRLQAGGQYSLCPANKAVTWSSDAPARLREAWSVFPHTESVVYTNNATDKLHASGDARITRAFSTFVLLRPEPLLHPLQLLETATQRLCGEAAD